MVDILPALNREAFSLILRKQHLCVFYGEMRQVTRNGP